AQGIFRSTDGQNVISFPIFENSPGISIYLRFTARKCIGHLLEITSQNTDQFFLLSLTSDGNIELFYKTSLGLGLITVPPPPGDSFCNGKRYLLTMKRYLEDVSFRVNRGKSVSTTQGALRVPFPRLYRMNVGFGFQGCVSGIDVLYYRTRTDRRAVGVSKGCVRASCGGILRHPTGVISTPNYPLPYPSDCTCQWAIILPDVYRVINLLVEDAALESDTNCGYDYLLFKDGLSNQVGSKLCGFLERPRLVTVKGNVAIVEFRSDSALNKKGVFIRYEAHVSRAPYNVSE
ncbi:hypothetical protein QZH41_012319, partial [Actinostola sp. cb2023]